MGSLKQHAGYLHIDHRDSPGLTARDVANMPGAFAVPGGSVLERDVLTCSHCERAVVLEPLRTRDRGYCQKCNHYVCDSCELIRAKTGACIPIKQTLDRMLNYAEKGIVLGHTELPPPALTLALRAEYVRMQDTIRTARDLYDQEDYDAAQPHFEALLAAGIAPTTTASALATIALFQGRRIEAIEYCRRVIETDPEERSGYDNLIMYVDLDPSTTPQDAFTLRQLWWKQCGAKEYEKRKPHNNDRNPDRPLRVGYFSGDFCHHSACTVFGPFALEHTDAIEAYFYSSTEPKKYDLITTAFSDSPRWRDVAGMSDDAVVAKARQDGIDLAVDLSGYTADNRLGVFAQRVAPVQITGWGYGTGLSWPAGVMDYLVADAGVVPEAHEDITEQIAYLPAAVPYALAEYIAPSPLSDVPTFGALHRGLKINDVCLDVWREILTRAPEARLIIKGDYCRSFVERMQQHLEPVLDRVAIVNVSTSKADHLAMWQHIDVALDAWPQSGGVASCEALWRGVPMVALRGDRIMSRVASSMLTQLELPEFIADSTEQYIECALAAIRNREHLAEVRAALPGRYAAWIQRSDYRTAVEQFYRTAWQTWCQS